MADLKLLKNRIDALTVFRDLLEDSCILSLCRYLESKEISDYCQFVLELYKANGGNLGEHIKSICGNSENVFVRAKGQKDIIPDCITKAAENELKTLQMIADLTVESLSSPIGSEEYLPRFVSGGTDIADYFRHRIENIGKYGYGIYAKNRMFYIGEDGNIVPVKNPDGTKLCDLVDYQAERQIVIDNTRALLEGKPAANILLTGDAGTGKSSTVKAIGNEMFGDGLRIIEVRKDQIYEIPKILDELADNPLKFILFIDDLSFLKDDDNFNALKAVLEGSVSARSKNVVIYATSNRRHIIKEKFSDREGDDIHRNDTMQELISLSERFGIHITFQKPSKAVFLKIVKHLAAEGGLDIADSELELLAERFALERGGRSPRLAKQFVDGLIAKQ